MPTIQTPPLRLKPAERSAAPSMWILRGPDAEKRLKDFVSHADQRLVQDIDAAVAEGADGKPMVILKTNRNARGKMLELNIPGAMPLGPHSPVNPNLFIPTDKQLNVPRIRPEKLRELFTQNPNHVAWLTPDEEEESLNQQIPEYVAGHGGRSPTRFNTESIGQEHFKPLGDLIGYTKPKTQPLKPWVPGESPFELQPFEEKPSTEPVQSVPDDRAVQRWEQDNLHARPVGYLAQRLNQLLGKGWSFHYPDPANDDYERRFVPPKNAPPRAVEAAQPLFNELLTRQTYGGQVPDAGSGQKPSAYPHGEFRAPAAPPPPPETPPAPTRPQGRPRAPKKPRTRPIPQATPEPMPPPEPSYTLPALTNAEAIARKEALEKQIIAEAQKEGEGQSDKAHTDPHLWAQLAVASQAAQLPDRASQAWQTALWEHEHDPQLIKGWADTEGVRDPIRDIETLLRQGHPSTQEAHKMAAAVMLAARERPEQMRTLAPQLSGWLEHNEPTMGVKAAWLSSKALSGVTHDTLGLARARDRLLEQLRNQPMETRHQDTPDLLKHLGGGQTLHPYLETVHDATANWLNQAAKVENGKGPITASRGIAELLSAIQMARIGSQSRAQELRRLAEPLIDRKHPMQAWLANALSHRLDQALQGQSIETPLPASVDALPGKSDAEVRDQQYAADTLRKNLASLVPGGNVDAFKTQLNMTNRLARMNVLSGDDLRREMRAMMSEDWSKMPPASRVSAIKGLANYLPRLPMGEAHRYLEQMTGELLNHQVGSSSESSDHYATAINHLLPELMQHNMVDSARELTGRLGDAIEKATPDNARLMAAVGTRNASHYLRRLGLANSSGLLASRTAAKFQQGVPQEKNGDRLQRLGVLSQIAGEQIASGNREAAQPALDEAHAELLKGGHARDNSHQHFQLAKSYLEALQHLPDKAEASARTVDLLGKLPPISASFGLNVPGSSSVRHLAIAERAHKAIAGEGSGQSTEAQNWMADDEYITRRKIHSDANSAIREAGL